MVVIKWDSLSLGCSNVCDEGKSFVQCFSFSVTPTSIKKRLLNSVLLKSDVLGAEKKTKMSNAGNPPRLELRATGLVHDFFNKTYNLGLFSYVTCDISSETYVINHELINAYDKALCTKIKFNL